jgi:hypothetical protein
MQHLVFLQADVLAKVLAQRKRVESRLWRGRLRHPCTVAQVGDVLYFKRVSGDVEAIARVQAVDAFAALRPPDIAALAGRFATAMDCASDDPYWQAKRHSRAARFFWLEAVRPWHIPQAAVPRGVRMGWVADWHPPAEADATMLMPEVFPPPRKVAGHLGEQLPLIEH